MVMQPFYFWGGGGRWGLSKVDFRCKLESISLSLSYFHTEPLFPKYLNYVYQHMFLSFLIYFAKCMVSGVIF